MRARRSEGKAMTAPLYAFVVTIVATVLCALGLLALSRAYERNQNQVDAYTAGHDQLRQVVLVDVGHRDGTAGIPPRMTHPTYKAAYDRAWWAVTDRNTRTAYDWQNEQ
jgi:hypothetical protein